MMKVEKKLWQIIRVSVVTVSISAFLSVSSMVPANGEEISTTTGGGQLANDPLTDWENNGNDTYYDSGRVGIGTMVPLADLHVVGSVQNMVDLYSNDAFAAGVIYRKSRGTVLSPLSVQPNDNVGMLRTQAYNGSSFVSISNLRSVAQSVSEGGNISGRFEFRAADTSGKMQYRMVIDEVGNVGIGTLSPTERLDVNGTTRTSVLEITGGSDLSEYFDINRGLKTDLNSTSQVPVKPGTLVSIDPENPGKLIVSSKAYDRAVAGIISGAGDVKPGMLMGHKGTAANGDYPVALTGRVYCYSDATKYSIKPGDLLTTSDTPGHAMKVTEYAKAHGAILGKAMSSLENGKGLVLVLVALQ